MIDQKTVLELAEKAGLLKYRSAHDEKLAFTFPIGNTSVAVITKLIELSMQLGADQERQSMCKLIKDSEPNEVVPTAILDGWDLAANSFEEAIRNRKDNHEQ